MERVQKALADAGFNADIEHDRAAGSTAIGYPNGFNGGTAADGYSWEVIALDNAISFGGNGHCVPGEVPTRGNPLNDAPTPTPALRA